ncbi:MAG: YbhB/YbcL family Raf kinase inhibitor-like protein [Desulfobacterales bacterium]|nr:MAG: YbhB/YbcL family Raf kinase inhibitor-like protein [Desulfobacterales bacterium]
MALATWPTESRGQLVNMLSGESTYSETAAVTPPTVMGGISIVGVRKAFGVTKALDGVNFHASVGEIHAVVGGNGSGKSTLAKVMSGVLPPDAGQVSVLGHSPSSPQEARAIGIGTVFQEVLVAEECSVVDNLFLGSDRLFAKSMPFKNKVAAAEALMLDLTGHEVDAGTLVGSLPLGIKQWITIGRALLWQPKVLILDESSAALDLDSTERLFAKIRQLRDQGVIIIIITHRIAELMLVSDKATVLRDGRDVGVLEKKDITEKNLLRLMTGKTPSSALSRSSTPEDRTGEVLLRTDRLRIWPRSPEITFGLHRGEIVGVAGLDGQGQSDFVRILAGVQKADQSHPTVANPAGGYAEIRGLADAATCGVSCVSGDRAREGIFANLSIYENLLLPMYRRRSKAGKLKLIHWGELTGAFDWEVERLSIKMGERTDRITSLSGGNQQKVMVGRAFAVNPNILILNDPARGIDITAKSDLYGHLVNFAALGKSVVYMSSEIEELIGLCSRVIVFRNGGIFDEFTGNSINPANILHAMFGQARGTYQDEPAEIAHEVDVADNVARGERDREIEGNFTLKSAAFADGARIPDRYAENNKVSPPLEWENPPKGTKSFALSVTDPDLPAEFNFPRAFAHWLLFDIPGSARRLPEGASPGGELPRGAKELNSDFVTFQIPGFGKGYGGPWPPDAAHRYVFTLYALKAESLDIAETADYAKFVSAVLPVTITTATLIGTYGPARRPLPGQ